MSTITKERIELFIKNPLENGLTRGEQMELARIALAPLEAEPVSQAYNLPQTHFEQVADLYEMQFEDGRTCTFHTDAQKAVQWLQACDGNRVQEYVKLERLQNALSGNSPVTPDGWVMVPKEPTQAMIKAWLSEIANFRGHAAGYRAAIEAAPQLEVNRG